MFISKYKSFFDHVLLRNLELFTVYFDLIDPFFVLVVETETKFVPFNHRVATVRLQFEFSMNKLVSFV